MNDSTLDLQAGSIAQLQLLQDEAGLRHVARVIGQIPGVSFLVTTPQQHGKFLLVREGQVFIVRAFSQDRVLAFTCRVLRSCVQPYPYLHLSYPDRREQVVVRHARRAQVLLAGQAQRAEACGWGAPLAIIVSDMSATGAMIEAVERLGAVGERLRIGLHLPIERMDEQAVTVDAVLRIVYEEDRDGGRCRYGVEFAGLEAAQELLLRAYVYEQLLGGDAARG